MSERTHIGGRDLWAATVVGLLLVLLVAVALFWRSDVFVAVVLTVVIAAFVDLHRVLAGPTKPVLGVVVAAAIVGLPASYALGAEGQVAGMLVLLALAAGWLIAKDVSRERLARTASTMLTGVWVLLPASFALILVAQPDGQLRLAATIGVVALADIGGFAIGVPFGRHKLSTRLSPNKTLEGLAGGVFLSAMVAGVTWPWLFNDAVWQGVAFGVVVAVACVLGDIAESGVKRALGVKDLGTFLPGHGGVLDRIDGLLFALPVATGLFLLM